MTNQDLYEEIRKRDRLISELVLTSIKHQSVKMDLLSGQQLKIAAKDCCDPFAAEYLADMRVTAEEFHALENKDFDTYRLLRGRREALTDELKRFSHEIRKMLLEGFDKFQYEFKIGKQ